MLIGQPPPESAVAWGDAHPGEADGVRLNTMAAVCVDEEAVRRRVGRGFEAGGVRPLIEGAVLGVPRGAFGAARTSRRVSHGWLRR